MKNLPRLTVLPESLILFGRFWMFLLAIFWVALFLTPTQKTTHAGIALLVVAIGISLIKAGWSHGRALADGARVLGTAPRMLWRAWLRRSLADVSLVWCIAVAAGTLALMQPGAPWTWSSAALLYSLLLVVGLTVALSHFGVWHWAWPWSIAAVLCTATACSEWQDVNAFLQEPTLWHLPLALAWPLLAASIAWRWRAQPPQGVAERKRMQFNLWHRCLNYSRRYQPLIAQGDQQRAQTSSIRGAYLPLLSFASLLFETPVYKAQWGGTASPWHFIMLWMCLLPVAQILICKDLHWRRLLGPNGLPRGRIGWHIVSSTLAVAVVVMALGATFIGLVLALIHASGVNLPFPHYGDIAKRCGVLPLELACLICVAAALRATAWFIPIYFSVLAGIAIAIVCAVFLCNANTLQSLWQLLSSLTSFVIGPAYLGVLLLASCAAILLANRLWTTQKLLPYLVKDARPGNEIIKGAKWFTRMGKSYE